MRSAMITNPSNKSPKSAPARVDWTKWETPIAVLANKIPGPAVFVNEDNLSFNFYDTHMLRHCIKMRMQNNQRVMVRLHRLDIPVFINPCTNYFSTCIPRGNYFNTLFDL